jgi:hypothetical protein
MAYQYAVCHCDECTSKRLVDAAPELLAALKEAAQELSLVCKWFDHPEQTTTETLRRATSAINKAEGRE